MLGACDRFQRRRESCRDGPFSVCRDDGTRVPHGGRMGSVRVRGAAVGMRHDQWAQFRLPSDQRTDPADRVATRVHLRRARGEHTVPGSGLRAAVAEASGRAAMGGTSSGMRVHDRVSDRMAAPGPRLCPWLTISVDDGQAARARRLGRALLVVVARAGEPWFALPRTVARQAAPVIADHRAVSRRGHAARGGHAAPQAAEGGVGAALTRASSA